MTIKIKFNHTKLLRITGKVLTYCTATFVTYAILAVLVDVITNGSNIL